MDAHGTADEHGPDDVRQGYERALRELRQDMGCTMERLIQYPHLVQALQRRSTRAKQAKTIEICISELRTLIGSLSDARHRDALLVALRLDPRFQQDTVTARRTDYSNYLRKSSEKEIKKLAVDSVRTLERRENRGISTLALYLSEGHKLGSESTRFSSLDESASDISLEPVTAAISLTYHFSETGVMVRQDTTRWLAGSGTNTSRHKTCSHQYYAESRRGVLECHADFGCHIVDQVEVDDGGILSTLELPKNLTTADGFFPIGYHVVVNSDCRCKPIVHWRPGIDTSRQVEFRLVFHPSIRPLRAWWFADSREVNAQLEPAEAEHRHLDVLDTGESFYVFKSFDNVHSATHGLFGVCWIWMAG